MLVGRFVSFSISQASAFVIIRESTTICYLIHLCNSHRIFFDVVFFYSIEFYSEHLPTHQIRSEIKKNQFSFSFESINMHRELWMGISNTKWQHVRSTCPYGIQPNQSFIQRGHIHAMHSNILDTKPKLMFTQNQFNPIDRKFVLDKNHKHFVQFPFTGVKPERPDGPKSNIQFIYCYCCRFTEIHQWILNIYTLIQYINQDLIDDYVCVWWSLSNIILPNLINDTKKALNYQLIN